MVTVIRNGLEEFKASYNPSKCQLYFISSEGITNSSVLVESISENCSEIFPALVMYPRVPLFSVSSLKEGGTGTRNHQLPEMSSCRGRLLLGVCWYHGYARTVPSASVCSVTIPSFPTETPSGPHLGLLFWQKGLMMGSVSALWFVLCFSLGFLVMMSRGSRVPTNGVLSALYIS